MILPRLREATFRGTKKCLSVSFVCAAAFAFAHDADTIAFYPFTEAAPGTSAAGITIVNDAGGRHPGVVTTSTDTGHVYHADRPGKYVLASSFAVTNTPEILFTNPGSVHFWNGKISFEGLSTAMSSNDDYTIEFFYKIQEVDKRGSAVQWGTPLKYNVGTYFAGSASNPEGYYPTYLMRSTDLYWQMYYVAYSAGGTLAASLPYNGQGNTWSGEWHHMALVYSKETHKLTAWGDYGQRSSQKVSLSNITNSVLEASVPVELGSGFRGLVSCLRVSKRALAPDYFLHASHLDAYPETTVFHYRLDGADGAEMSTVTNYAYGGHPYAGQLQNWDTPMKLYTANAEVHVATSTNSLGEPVAVGAEFSSATGFNKQLVDDGDGSRPRQNGGSGHFHSLERMHETSQLDASGIYLDGANYQHVTNGSFTMEATMKLDITTWLAKQKNSSMRRYPIFLLYGNVTYVFEWELVAIMDSDNCFRLEGDAYYPGPTLTKIAHYNGQNYARVDKNFLKDDKWHHFAVVYDDSALTFRLYVDYVLKDERTVTARYRPLYKNCHVWIGDGGKVNLSGFEGWIDEVRYTRKALSPSQFIRFMSPRGTTIIFK